MRVAEKSEVGTPEHVLNAIVRVAILSPERLRRFLRRWEKDDSHVDDIIGASLLNAIKCIHSFTGVSSVEVWFYGVCKNTARQHVAAKVRNNRDFFEVDDFELVEQQIIDFNTLAIDDELIKKQQLEMVAELLSNLPSDQQKIFQAIYVDGRSYTEVSQQFDIPLGTVKSRVNRVRVNLIERISHLCQAEV
jgi:RNA polymerase sigma-70 factor (ECF subfamily)